MSRTSTAVLNSFIYTYRNKQPYTPKKFILYSPSPIGGIIGPTGPTGPVGYRYSGITVGFVLITPSSGSVSFQVSTNLAYNYGTPVYVSSAETYTNNFLGVVLYYNPSTGDMTIGTITTIHGTFTAADVYTVNAPEYIYVGPQGPQGIQGPRGPTGPNGYTGPQGPYVPMSGGNPDLIILFQKGFDCGDVE